MQSIEIINSPYAEFLDTKSEEELEEFSMMFRSTDCIFKSGKSLLAFEVESASVRDAVLEGMSDRLDWEIAACELPEMPVYTEVEEVEELLSWEDLEVELDSESEIVEADEESADQLVDQIVEQQFTTITQVKEIVAQEQRE